MGIVLQDATVESDVESFIRYARKQGGRRITLIKTRDDTVTLRPAVTSRMDTLVLRNAVKEVWDRIEKGLSGEEPDVLTGDSWVPGDDTVPRQA